MITVIKETYQTEEIDYNTGFCVLKHLPERILTGQTAVVGAVGKFYNQRVVM